MSKLDQLIELDFKKHTEHTLWRIKSYKYTDHAVGFGDYEVDSSSMWIDSDKKPHCSECMSDDVHEQFGGNDWGGYKCDECGHQECDKGYNIFDFINSLPHTQILELPNTINIEGKYPEFKIKQK